MGFSFGMKENMADKKPNPKIEAKLKQIKTRLDKEIKIDRENRDDGVTCLNMIAGKGHWSPTEEDDRAKAGRPCLKINQLPKYLNQYTGEMLQNRARIEIRPASNNANAQIAKIREGYVRQVEYESEAEAIYAWAGKHAAGGGLGAWRVITVETEENPFIQSIRIKQIDNALSVYLENGGRGDEPNYGFILHKMAKDDFESEYGTVEGADTTALSATGYSYDNEVADKDFVTFGEYFERQNEDVQMCLFDDGTILPKDKAEEKIKLWEEHEADKEKATLAKAAMVADASVIPSQSPTAGTAPPTQGMPGQGAPAASISPNAAQPQSLPQQAPGQPSANAPGSSAMPGQGMLPKSQPKPEIVKRKTTKKTIIKRFLFSSGTIFLPKGVDGSPLDGELVPGKYIPIFLVSGRQMNIAGKTVRSALVKDAIDPQKFLNYEVSAAAEITALQPKAPWLVTAEMIEGYEEDYKQANIKNFPYLKYKIDPLNPQAHPVRQGPGEPPAAIFQLINQSDGWIKSTIGQFNADIGAEGPERSGTAIRSRQKPGDTGTYEFFVNLNYQIARTGKVINAMMTEVIDSARDIPVRAQNGTESFVPVNMAAGDALDMVLRSPERYQDINVKELRKLISTDGRGALYNMLGVGEYGVRAKAGPSYATQREETAANMERILQYAPDQIPFYLDLIAEYQDWPGADEFRERARRKMPPELVKLRPGEQPVPPKPNPQLIKIMAEIKQKEADTKLKLTKAVTEQLKAAKELQGSKPEMEKVVYSIIQKLLAPEPDEGMGGGEPASIQPMRG